MFKNNKPTTKVVEPPVIMDTSAIIDGRVLAVAKTGFIPNRLIVAQFVIAELQQLADGSNSHKRERARFGMDVIKELQELKNVRVIINRDKFPNIEEVDDKLVALAKQEKGYLFTTDYNLGKVAEIEGVKVLNVNELAQSLRPVILPGEELEIKVIQRGSERGQGVAYLDDGTMVVIENGAKFVGKKVKIEFSRTLQTVAGKMMFATLVKSSRPSKEEKPQHLSGSSRPPRKTQSKPTKNNRSKIQSVNKRQQHKKPPVSKARSNQNKRRPRRQHPEDKLMDAIANDKTIS
jgi:uncharacterized protein YacL